MRLTREVRFTLLPPGPAPAPTPRVDNAWGGWPPPVTVAPWLAARVTVSGEPDTDTGYLVNIQQIDRLFRSHAIPHARSAFARSDPPPTPERLTASLAHAFASAWYDTAPAASLDAFELAITPLLCVCIRFQENGTMYRTHRFEFSASHRLYCPHLSVEENHRIFGKCANPNGHGHNYEVEITLAGTPGPDGTIEPLPDVERAVRERLIDHFDHRHLNLDVPEFASLNPSVENIARVAFQRLAGAFTRARLVRVRVYETPKTWADCEPDDLHP